MIRWFRASLEGSYSGVLNPSVPATLGRRYRLQVYRAALRDLRWTDAPPEPSAPSADANALWQARIDHAHLAGVRGPGTWYEGPIFDVSIRSVQLTHPVERSGRSFGRIVGEAIGWLELPPPPAAPEVVVSEASVAMAVAGESTTDKPALQGTVFTQEKPTEAADAPAPEASDVLRALDTVSDPEAPAAVSGDGTTKAVRRIPALLPVVAFVALVGIALGVGSGALACGLWALFMLPTLLARRLFSGVVRDSGFIRGFGFVLMALQLMCVSALVSQAWQTGCPVFSLWPALGVVLVLFPAGLLPSAWPFTCSALGLALVLATLGRPPDARCTPAKPQNAAVQPARAAELRASTRAARS